MLRMEVAPVATGGSCCVPHLGPLMRETGHGTLVVCLVTHTHPVSILTLFVLVEAV